MLFWMVREKIDIIESLSGLGWGVRGVDSPQVVKEPQAREKAGLG